MSIIVGIDSSSVSAGCAVLKDGEIIAHGFIHNGLTHSQTLLPLISEVIAKSKAKHDDIDYYAVTVGPGSFTGLRIGLATIKGMAAPFDTKCIGISSLEAAAFNAYCKTKAADAVICAVMDARCKQVYNALFCVNDGKLERICDDRALSIDELKTELDKMNKKVLLCGDGAKICREAFGDSFEFAELWGEDVYVSGESVAKLGEKYINSAVDYYSLMPKYLRLPQAQRELKKKAKSD